MSLPHLSLFFLASDWICGQASYTGFSSDFFQIVDINIVAYGPYEYNNNITLPSNIRISFSAFRQYFEVMLNRTYPIDSEIAVNIVGEENRVFTWKPPLYEGIKHVRGRTMIAMGMYNTPNNTLVGFVTAWDVTYYIEPARFHFPKYSSPKALLVHKVDSPPPELFPDQNGANVSSTCFVELIADFVFYEALMENIQIVASRIYLHVRYANTILQSNDFGDRVLRLATKSITIHNVHDAAKYPFHKYVWPDEYMHHYRPLTNESCIVAVFTNNMFEEIRGLAYASSACSEPTDFSQQYNRLMVTSRNMHDGKQIPLYGTLIAFTHGVGHTFGGLHNRPSDYKKNAPNCFSRWNGLRYLLSIPHNSRDYFFRKTGRFSHCNIRLMKDYIRRKGRCFKISTINRTK